MLFSVIVVGFLFQRFINNTWYKTLVTSLTHDLQNDLLPILFKILPRIVIKTLYLALFFYQNILLKMDVTSQ